jgi:hypothetical protein
MNTPMRIDRIITILAIVAMFIGVFWLVYLLRGFELSGLLEDPAFIVILPILIAMSLPGFF